MASCNRRGKVGVIEGVAIVAGVDGGVDSVHAVDECGPVVYRRFVAAVVPGEMNTFFVFQPNTIR